MAFARADQQFATVPGVTYELTFDITDADAGALVEVGTSQGASDLLSQPTTAVQSYSFEFTATSLTSWIRFSLTGSAPKDSLVDNVSVMAITAGTIEGLGLWQLLIGVADNHTITWDFLKSLGHIRDPRKTPVLADLEREFGIYSNEALTEQVRRDKLAAIKYARVGTGSKDQLQNALINAGFTTEIINNGFFHRNIDGWVTVGTASWLSPGHLKLADDSAIADQSFVTEVGKIYTVKWQIVSSETGTLKIGSAQGFSDLLSVAWTARGNKVGQFTATGTTSWIRLQGIPGNITVLDNISVTTNPSLLVWENSPAQDPDLFFAQYLAQGGEGLAQCGEALAQCGSFDGELIVNGDIFEFDVDYTVLCGEALAQCGEPAATCGELSGVTRTKIVFAVATDPTKWAFVFFVCGAATFNPTTGPTTICGEALAQCGEPAAQCADFQGELKTIDFVDVPYARRADLVRLILQIKPIHSWCALLVNFT